MKINFKHEKVLESPIELFADKIMEKEENGKAERYRYG